MAYRDFAKRRPIIGGLFIPLVGALVTSAALLPFIPWGLALLAGVVAFSLIINRTY